MYLKNIRFSILFQLQEFLDEYKSSNLQIIAICEKICDTPLINLKPNFAYDISELVDELAKNITSTIEIIIKYFQQIIQFIILVFEGFEFHMSSVSKYNVMIFPFYKKELQFLTISGNFFQNIRLISPGTTPQMV